jgi:hypothetical protein
MLAGFTQLADKLSEFATNFVSFNSCKFVQFVARKTNCITPVSAEARGKSERIQCPTGHLPSPHPPAPSPLPPGGRGEGVPPQASARRAFGPRAAGVG